MGKLLSTHHTTYLQHLCSLERLFTPAIGTCTHSYNHPCVTGVLETYQKDIQTLGGAFHYKDAGAFHCFTLLLVL